MSSAALVTPSADFVPRPPMLLVLAAFAAIYLIWGSSYLALKIAVTEFPPLMAIAVRTSSAGIVMLIMALVMRVPFPRGREIGRCALVGCLFFAGDHGLLSLVQGRVPSGITAVIMALVPLMIPVFDWMLPGGRAPRPVTVIALLIGFAGIVVLFAPGDGGQVIAPLDCLVLILAASGWALGTGVARRAPRSAQGTLSAGALQHLFGGGLVGLAALGTGDLAQFAASPPSAAGWAAVAYLMVFGSLIGFMAFTWLLKVSTPARVGTYGFVNPIVALCLGAAIAGEPLGATSLIASAMIIMAVAIVLLRDR